MSRGLASATGVEGLAPEASRSTPQNGRARIWVMDEAAVRSHADAHKHAVIAGDMDRGALDLLDECMPQAVEVMKRMPRKVVRAEVEGVEPQGDEWRVRILYYGEDDARTRVESFWVEQGGRPMVRAARVIDEDP